MSDKHHKTVVVDFDGTLAEDKKFPDFGEPMAGAIKAMKRLKEAGYEIVIFTCRMNLEHGSRVVEIQRRGIEEWLKRHDVPYDKIDTGKDGKPFGIIIDNKAIPYGGHKTDWEDIAERLVNDRESIYSSLDRG